MKQHSATTRRQGEFAWRLGAGADTIGAARQAFVSWLAASSTDPELLQDMSVVVSELASNALDGGGSEGLSAELWAEVADDVLHIVVSNDVPANAPDVRHWDLDDPLRGGGRGLMIVRAYTDTLTVESTSDTVSVRCTRHLVPAS